MTLSTSTCLAAQRVNFGVNSERGALRMSERATVLAKPCEHTAVQCVHTFNQLLGSLLGGGGRAGSSGLGPTSWLYGEIR